MAKKFYVVWQGKETGIFTDWKKCEASIKGVAGARYKSFSTREEAEKALAESPFKHIGQNKVVKPTASPDKIKRVGKPVVPSLSVDAAWNTASGVMEYRGVDTATKKELFRMGPYDDGTNNVGEFLALVHGLALLKKNNLSYPIYSDSKTALAWVRNRQTKTTLQRTGRNDVLFDLMQRALDWLSKNSYENPLLKWETDVWGEIPADFGRK